MTAPPATALAAFGLTATGPAVPVAGGALHRTWRVPTALGPVALKVLAHGGHPGWAAELDRAVAFEQAAWSAGTVPMAEPRRTADGAPLARVGDDVVRAHRWVDGPAGTAAPATDARLRALGRTVAAVLALGVPGGTTADLPTNALDAYDDTVAEARSVGAPFAADLAALAAPVARLREELVALAAERRPLVMGHGDLHPRNTVVVDGVDVLLDWDEAAPVLPASHLLGAALAFGGPDAVAVVEAGWAEAGGGPLDRRAADVPLRNEQLRTVLFHAWRALGHRGVAAPARAHSASLVPTLAVTWRSAGV